MHWCVIGTESILIVAIVDCYLDRHRSVYQANDSGRDSDEVGVPAIGGTSESAQPKKVSTSFGWNDNSLRD